MLRNAVSAGIFALLLGGSAQAKVLLDFYVDPPTVANTAANGVTSTRSGAGTWQLYALDISTTDFGISSYDITINNVTSVLHRSPTTNISDNDPDNPQNFGAGFSLLRAASVATGIQASEPLPTNSGYMVTGFGKTAGSFSAFAPTINPAASVVGPTASGSWGNYIDPSLAPIAGHHWLFLAEGNYNGNKPTIQSVIVNAITVFATNSSGTPPFASALAQTTVEGVFDSPAPEIHPLSLSISRPADCVNNCSVAGIVTATDFPLLWGPDGPGITLASYMPGFGAPASAPGLALRALWNPATQAFSWNTAGSSTGTYVWNVLAGNEGGTGTGTITVEVHVPEPGSVVLAALALIGLVGIVGRRR